MPTLLLVDGSSYLYRAFHAMPDLRTTRSEPTGALHGVLNMLRRLESDYQARDVAYKACVFDAKGKTFRDHWYPQYKANRPPMPADMVSQIEPLHAAIAALGWPLLIVDGVEADDVIGTLAQQAAAQGVSVVVSTSDKDLAQLVGPQVQLVNTMSNEVLDEAGVLAKFGVPAERIVDYLALVGDAVDNVPGVDKVGAKTAVKWLNQHGSLAGVIAAATDMGGVVGQNLRRALDFLPLAQRLVTVRCDLELPLAVADLGPRPVDRERLAELFAHYEMRSWLRDVQEGPQGGAATAAPPSALAGSTPLPPLAQPAQPSLLSDDAHRANYETILDEAAFERWLAKVDASPLTALDTETTSLDPFAARIVGVSLAVAEGEAAYLPLAHCYPGGPDQLPCEATLARLKPWLESTKHAKIGQNLKYDQHVLANHGIKLAGVVHDTLLQSYVLESGKDGARGHDLGRLATRHLGLATIPYEALCGKGAKQISFAQVAIEQAAEYAAEDADLCLRLHARLYPQITADAGLARVYATIEMPVREILFRMERTGVLIDAQLLSRTEWRDRQAPARARSAGARGGRAAVQCQLAEAAGRNPLRYAGSASEEENAFGGAFDRRRSALGVGARLPAAQDPARIATAGQAQRYLYRQAAENGQCARAGACIPVTRRRLRSPAAWRRAIPTCRTFPCARAKDGASARRSLPRREVRL
jgi:DNA polymerase-1